MILLIQENTVPAQVILNLLQSFVKERRLIIQENTVPAQVILNLLQSFVKE